MAEKIDEWFDELSEEWVSQPRGSSPRSSLHGNSSRLSQQGSQSRIPLPKSPASNSPASLQRRPGLTKSLSAGTNSVSGPLKDSTSKLNISQNRPFPKQTKNKLRRTSTDSALSAQHGTVQHKLRKTSTSGDENLKSTSEWKRRVLHGELKLGEKKDLFSPIGLESVFQAPSTRKPPLRHRPKTFEHQSTQGLRSSPPSLPNATRNSSQKRQKFRLNSEKGLNEESELSSIRLGAKEAFNGTGEFENSLSLPSMIPDGTQSSQQHDTNDTPEPIIQPPPATNHPLDPMVDSTEPKSRIVSNYSELRNEGISPVSLPALHFGSDGNFPPETPERSLLGSHQPTSDPQNSKYLPDIHNQRKSTSFDQKNLSTPQLADWTSQSLPDDLSMGTQEFNTRGGFVNFRRGCDSAERSFLKKPLSSSIQRPNETTLPHSSSPSIIRHRTTQSAPSTQTSQQIHCKGSGSLRDSAPVTPPRNLHQQAFSSPEKPRASGSPLKLFDKYDTFTNDHLIRRLSKFEESFHEGRGPEGEPGNAKAPQGHERSILAPLPESPDTEQKTHLDRPNDFGGGDLDEYEFSHEGSDDAGWPAPKPQAEDEEVESKELKSHDVSASPRSVQSAPLTSPQTQMHNLDSNIGNFNSSDHWLGVAEQQEIKQDKVAWKDGKRLPNSPKKPSQAKRRRISYVEENGDVIARHKLRPSLTNSTHSTMSVIGKRKDARYDSNSQFADEQVLASRRILRPRAPTPGQMKYGSYQRQGEHSPTTPKQEPSPKDLFDKIKGLSSQDPPTSPTEALAADLANFALDVAQDITSGVRKPSVTTGDFFEQAKAIMQHIRSKNRSPTIVEEATTSKEPALGHIEEMSYEDSTVDRFSRPPSREGLSLRRLRAPQEVDPRIASHLRKFEDHDGIVEGLHVPNEPLAAARADQSQDFSVVSDPPNIRIFSQVERELPDRSNDQYNAHEHLSTGTDSPQTIPSSNASTDSSKQSSSASGSRSKEFIAPEKVAHFLEKEVAGMTYDHSRKVWIKKKSSDPRLSASDKSEGLTEDDPLGDIPDLSTDELEEQARLKSVGATPFRERNQLNQKRTTKRESPPATSPTIREDPAQQLELESSVLSHRSTVETGAARTETRATSLDQPEANDKTQEPRVEDHQFSAEKAEGEVEREIGILEGRTWKTPVNARKHQQPRVVTVSFSSPITDSRESPYHGINSYDGYDIDSDLDLTSSPEKPPPSKPASSLRTKRGHHRRGRRQPIAQGSYSTRQISRIDEQEEMSFHESLQLNQELSFSVVLHTPRQTQVAREEEEKSVIKLPSSTGKQMDGTFQLTPLPDFTFNQSDELQPLNANGLPKKKGLLCAKDVEDRFSFAIKDLVRKITDIEPFEPYWDYLRRLDLGNRNLDSLHMLDEFCGRVEELNVSNNALAQLNGVPSSLRVLSAQGNALSNLTAWGHLQNLQYLDISGNDVSSLANLQGLCHLRELRADDNAIEDINGLAGLNGLLHLRLRRNGIEGVDLRNLSL